MSVSGNYVSISKNSYGTGDKSQLSWMIPYGEEFGIGATQTFSQPIKKLFAELKEGLLSVEHNMSGSLPAIVTKFTMDMSDLFGVKFFQQDYYASAWTGSEPSSFTLKLKFFRGMKGGKWSAKNEVYIPTQAMMALTVITNTAVNGIGFSPAPTGADVFTSFAADFILGIINSASAVVKAATEILSIKKIVTDKRDSGKPLDIVHNNTWNVSFGYSSGGLTIDDSYVSLNNLVVTTSNVSYSPQLACDDTATDKKWYPISGSVDLTFMTQKLLSAGNFNK